MYTRRKMIIYGTSLALTPLQRLLASKPETEFWNTVDPSQWSDKQLSSLLNKSPWAKEATVEIDFARMMSNGGGPPAGGPPGGGGMPGGGGGMPGGGPPEFHIILRWESSKPLRLARKSEKQDSTDTYIVGMAGLPARLGQGADSAPEAGADRLEQLKADLLATTRLKTKTKAAIGPSDISTVGTGDNLTIFFSFPRSYAITDDDKEGYFTSAMGPLNIKCKFTLKDMR